MKKMLLLGIAALSLVAVAPAQGALTMNGETGVISVPNAMVAAPMSFEVAADYVNLDDMMVPIRLGVGLIEGLEVGANYTYWDVEGVDYILGVNAKYQLPLEVVEGLKIAAGGGYGMTGTDGDDISAIAVYGVASYVVDVEGISLTGSAGIDWERVSVGDADEDGVGFFAAAEVGLGMVEGLGVAAEFASENGDLGNDTVGVVVRFALPMVPGLTVQAGFSDFASDDMEIFAGAQFAFGGM